MMRDFISLLQELFWVICEANIDMPDYLWHSVEATCFWSLLHLSLNLIYALRYLVLDVYKRQVLRVANWVYFSDVVGEEAW